MSKFITTDPLKLGGEDYGRVVVEVSRYARDPRGVHGQPTITLTGFDTYPGEPIAVATVCGPFSGPGFPFTLIKNYSENTGILDFLITAGIVTPRPELDMMTEYVTLHGAELVHPALLAHQNVPEGETS